jgi:hypothetical protein
MPILEGDFPFNKKNEQPAELQNQETEEFKFSDPESLKERIQKTKKLIVQAKKEGDDFRDGELTKYLAILEKKLRNFDDDGGKKPWFKKLFRKGV